MIARTPAELTAFVRNNTRILPPPHVPSIRLHLTDEAVELWTRTEEELNEMGLPPPFWAFAWAGGQAVARYILDNPKIVAGKRVLDFAAGGGIAAIAACLAGASHVTANEIDPFAIAVMRLNAGLNDVAFDVAETDLLTAPAPECDVLIAGDVCYERPMSDRVIAWLEAAAKRGTDVLIGDPGRSYLPKDRLEAPVAYEVPVTRALEDADVKKTTVWRFR